MSNPHCRIGKIKSHGGAEIHIIRTVKPQTEIVKMLQEELQKAESGETVAFAMAAVTRDGWTDNRFYVADGVHDLFLAGACERLKHRIVRHDP